MNGFRYAVFVITYNRRDILVDTIYKLNSQTLPPEKILVVDNYGLDGVVDILPKLKLDNLSYLNVGNNIGPAGAANLGFKYLFDLEYEWVLWVDDDDPPKSDLLISQLTGIIKNTNNIKLGAVGAVGELFDKRLAKIKRYDDCQLKGYLPVDTISGNMFPLVNRRVYEEGVLPDERLFFGFEELDFCLSMKRKGFKILVSGDLIYDFRLNSGRLGLKSVKNIRRRFVDLWREYYSTRNMLFILISKDKNYLGGSVFIFRKLIKCFLGFKYGIEYGLNNAYYILIGIVHFFSGFMGLTLKPNSK